VAGDTRIESGIEHWRRRALAVVVWSALGVGAAPLALALADTASPLPPAYRLGSLAIFLLTLAVALAKRVPHAVRAWAFVLVGLALAVLMLAARGLGGSGRLVLVVVPLYATVLVGPRSGFAAAALGVGAFAVTASLISSGAIAPLPVAAAGPRAARFWLLQGATLALVLTPVLIVVTRFIALLQRVVAAERASAARIAEADRERRRLERVLLETGERERREVGHQLHDGPCQQLTAALLRCQVAQRTLAGRGAAEEAAHVGAIADTLDASLGEIHDLARGLSPAELSPAALPGALHDLAQRTRVTTGIACDVQHDGLAQPASAEVATQLFRIAQEAVGNAVRHARPQHITIVFERTESSLRLLARDDGAGMAAGAGDGGMGMRIMRYRAELIGAALTVGPAPSGGTDVACSLPHLEPSGRGGEGA
jgi:signal transduction histidine kinase